VEVDLGLASVEPPERLFHGTATRSVDAIRAEGLVRQTRQHVPPLAGRRDRRPRRPAPRQAVVLIVRAGQMHRDGHAFYRSDNGVWLTDSVPPEYLEIPG
jgi:putative RNA 2'-phosphotransferase